MPKGNLCAKDATKNTEPGAIPVEENRFPYSIFSRPPIVIGLILPFVIAAWPEELAIRTHGRRAPHWRNRHFFNMLSLSLAQREENSTASSVKASTAALELTQAMRVAADSGHEIGIHDGSRLTFEGGPIGLQSVIERIEGKAIFCQTFACSFVTRALGH